MREAIAQIISELDHPDAQIRRELMDQLVAFGSDGIDAISANFSLASPKIKIALIQVMREIGDSAAVLPMMRFVFDKKGDNTVADARGLAMRVLGDLGEDSQAQKLFDFALDLVDDQDAFVRAGACAILGRFGDSRAKGILRERLTDDEIVADAAQKALLRLEVVEQPGLKSHYGDDELLQNIRGESGGQRDFFVEELKKRDNAFELSAELVATRGRGMMVGLNVIAELNDPRGRHIALNVLESVTDATQLAVALRLLAHHLDGDANEEEVEAIRQRYYHNDRFVQLAALGAASRSGDHDLLQRAVGELLKTNDTESQRLILIGLSKALPEQSRWAFPKLREFFLDLRDLKQTDEIKRLQAYSLRAIRRSVAAVGIGVREAQTLAFVALQQANGHQPVIVTAIELLEKTTPEPLADSERWSDEKTMALANCLDDGTAKTDLAILRLLHAGAPTGLAELVAPLQPLAFAQSEWVIEFVIPLLSQIGTAEAMRLVDDLSKDADENIRHAAEAAKRRKRNNSEFIEAEFE